MSVRNYIVKPVLRSDIRSFIETWHYSKSINGVKSEHCFGLFDGEVMIGAMLFGKLGMANVWKKYGDSADQVLELRRLCCIDDTPKNTESYFIGKCLRWLAKHTEVLTIVSYADTNQGHEGTIYKASNFKYIGKSSQSRVIIRLSDNKSYHDKTIRTKYKGKLKSYAKKLKDQLENGEAVYKKQLGKNIYLYTLRR